MKHFAVTLLLFLFAAWSLDIETRLYFHQTSIDSQRDAASFLSTDDYPKWLKQAGYSPNDFQAILPLPFFNVGSERIGVGKSGSAYEAFKSSFLLGLPIATCNMSRTSISLAMKTAQLLADSLIEKQVLKDYPNGKPLLVVSTKEWLIPSENFVVRHSKLIFENESIRMYLLPLENLKPNYSVVRAFKSRLDSANTNGLVKSNLPTDAVVYNGFENEPSRFIFYGKGAAYLEKGDLPLFKGKINNATDNMPLNFSIWIKMFKEPETVPVLWYKQYDASGNMIEQKNLSPGYSFDIVGDWVKLPCDFTLFSKNNTLEFYINGEKIAADEMLIRPAQQNVITNEKPDGSFFIDNIPVPAE
jgi:hypothetical protein